MHLRWWEVGMLCTLFGVGWTFLMDRIAKRYHIRERLGDFLDRKIDEWWDRRAERVADWLEGRRIRKLYAGVTCKEDLPEFDQFFWPDIEPHLKRKG